MFFLWEIFTFFYYRYVVYGTHKEMCDTWCRNLKLINFNEFNEWFNSKEWATIPGYRNSLFNKDGVSGRCQCHASIISENYTGYVLSSPYDLFLANREIKRKIKQLRYL